MDFLDPEKMRRHIIMVFVGYICIGIVIVISAVILLYQSSGFGIGKDGEVIQNGFVFTATTPSGAEVYIDGKDTGFKTDKRLVLPAGQYILQFKKPGYLPWSRQISFQGGSVNRYDYAFMVPKQLDTSLVKKYDRAPTFSTQSPDRRWVVVQTANSIRDFNVYDLKNPTDPPEHITLPASLLTTGKKQSWKFLEWSNDNTHVLLQHYYDTKSEYILLNRPDAAQSVNLTRKLQVNPTELHLINKKYDQYFLYDAKTKVLQRTSLGGVKPVNYLKNVLAFKSYGDDTVLYVTDDTKSTSPTDTQVAVKLTSGDQTYTIRRMAAGKNYLLELTKYSGDLIVAAGSDTEDKVVVYRNPAEQINNPNIGVAVQVATLKVKDPDYLAFSANTRFIMTENGRQFALYDAEADKTYSYTMEQPLDKPQLHATWMDGHRLVYVSHGKLYEFDYDQTNGHVLQAMNPAYLPDFTPNYDRVFSLSPQRDSPSKLRMADTWLRIPADR